jgi:chromatin segregation and condensation protein Rec8/ScpA/Scc1 (kleisin family)
MLLPLPAVGEEEDEGDPREELISGWSSTASSGKPRDARQGSGSAVAVRARHAAGEEGPLPLAPATLFDLMDALNRVMSRMPETQVYEVRGELYDVEDKMALITRIIAEDGAVSFTTLLSRCRARAR